MSTVATTASLCQVPDVLPYFLPVGGVNILAGAPGVGKTAWLAGLLRAIRDGEPIFGHPTTRVPPLGFVGTDRSWLNGAAWWFEQAGFPEIAHYCPQDDLSYNLRNLRRKHERTDVLASFMDRLQLPPGAVIGVDPVTPFLGGNLLDYDTCYVASQEIQRYLHMRQYTLIGTAHAGKQRADASDRYLRMQDRILGSAALIGFGDTTMYLASPEELEQPYYGFHWAPHRAKAETHYLKRTETGLFVPYVPPQHDDAAHTDRLLPYIPDTEPIGLTDLVDRVQEIPLSRSTVQRCLKRLLSQNLIVKHGRDQYQRIRVQ